MTKQDIIDKCYIAGLEVKITNTGTKSEHWRFITSETPRKCLLQYWPRTGLLLEASGARSSAKCHEDAFFMALDLIALSHGNVPPSEVRAGINEIERGEGRTHQQVFDHLRRRR